MPRNRDTYKCCVDIWHRVGGRQFTWLDVQDLLKSPSQLSSLAYRGYAIQVKPPTGHGHTYQMAVWQLTAQAQCLADIRGAKWA